MRKFLCKCVCLLVLHATTTESIRLVMVTDSTPWINIINRLLILPKKVHGSRRFDKKNEFARAEPRVNDGNL